jgi:hypothetical protein
MLPRVQALVVTITPGEFESITPHRLDSEQHILSGIVAHVSCRLIALQENSLSLAARARAGIPESRKVHRSHMLIIPQ